ncbi:Na+/H+ antiporter subunit A [Solicola sp. PLA-1-18]|uniref:Na+/H+ antiporter subunit A n=1 Tax=Solicola sp. PLA-1-18 TaxID=3380532 RepID=UPI003B77AD73
MLLLVVLHLVAAAVAPALTRLLDRRAFLVLALVPAGSLVWILTQTATVTGADARPVEQVTPWVPALRMELAFSLDTLSWFLAVLVTGVGALVLVYCAWYFREGDPEIWRFSAVLTGFAGSMLGLVLSEDFLLLFIFWELTTVFSYLLVGHNPERKANRRAAMSALIVTTFGGLSMLVGIIVLGQRVGSYRISEIVAAEPTGAAVTAAVALILVGAVSKSALVPFHFWLPGAMAAPTPVSAYLHAAAMVKAGIFLVALLAPAFADDPIWRPSLLVLGVLTMLVGGLRALRQHDVKLLLAYGTVSQLGFLMAIVALGTRNAALAGVAMICAHALFKAALFMVVGIVDRTCGTRDLRELTGLARRMPVLLVVTVLSAASMAGLPPLAGFVAKETVFASFEEVAHGEGGTGLAPWVGWVALAGLVVGSLLTVAYSARFVWGVFADKVGAELPREPARIPAGFLAPAVVLAAASLVVGFLGAPWTSLAEGYSTDFPAGESQEYLALWHGFELPLLLSAIAVVGGVVLHLQRYRTEVLQAQFTHLPDAERAYQWGMRGVDRLAVEVTGATQRGSLPIYLGTIVLALVLVPGTALVMAHDGFGDVVAWQNPAQAVVAAIMAAAAIAAVRSRKRLKAVILVGVVGYGMAVMFVLHGAPDLGLTQVLVETVTLVIILLVLRRLPAYFSDRPLTIARWWRVTIGVLAGVAVGGYALAASGSRTLDPVSDAFAREAYDFGGGENVVNVTLVDIRAWDTMGELSVLVVAATGVASLIFLITGRTGRVRPDEAIDNPSRWLRAGRTLSHERRSVIFEIVTRLVFHMIMVFSLFLVFSGHNEPGGGFAGGLIGGLALMVRYLAGGRHELDEAAPVDAGHLMGLGLVIATISALAPLLFGGEVLQTAVLEGTFGWLGDIKLVTSLFFDFGVYLVVIGLMLDVLRSLGGGIDRGAVEDDPEVDDPAHADAAPAEGLS